MNEAIKKKRREEYVGGDVADHLSDVSKKNNDAVIVVVNHSGGKDSMRMLHRLREEYSDVETICVTADTGFETPEADSGGRMVKMRCASLANPVPVVVVRKCQEDLSRDGRASRKVSVSAVPAVHFRPEARSDLSGSSAHSRTRLSMYYCLPIFEETEQQVLEWHWQTGTPLHPIYVPEFHGDGTTGGYLRRFSCRLCIFASDKDVAAVAEHDPEAFALVSNLERKIGFTMKSGRSLMQILQTETGAIGEGRGAGMPGIRDVRKPKSGRQLRSSGPIRMRGRMGASHECDA